MTSLEDNLNGRQPRCKTTSMEDDFNGIWPQWKTISMEDNLHARQPQWKTTSMEDDLHGRWLQWKTSSNGLSSQFCTELGPAQPQLVSFIVNIYLQLWNIKITSLKGCVGKSLLILSYRQIQNHKINIFYCNQNSIFGEYVLETYIWLRSTWHKLITFIVLRVY